MFCKGSSLSVSPCRLYFLMHSLNTHIVHVHTFFGVCCCQIHLMCWWFLAHRTWCHFFLTCYMWVAFDPFDMISCYRHVYRLWSGHDVLYRLFNYQCPHVVSIVRLHSIIFHIVHVHTWSGVCCCQTHLTCWWFRAHWTWRHVSVTCYMLVAFGASDMISCYWHVYHLWSELIRPDQTRPDQTRPDHIRSD
jgi:hypothetical protein